MTNVLKATVSTNDILQAVQKVLPNVPTLDYRGRDSLDFYDVSIGNIKGLVQEGIILASRAKAKETPRWLITGRNTEGQDVVLFTWRGNKESGIAQAGIDAAKHGQTYTSFGARALAY